MEMRGVILGSSSVYRRKLMERLQIPFEVEAPDFDEASVKELDLPAMETAQQLARSKARIVASRHPHDIVIGSDQIAAASQNGAIFDKPGSADGAIEQLRSLRGKEHQLLTAVAIAHSDQLVEFCDVTRLQMRDLSDQEIERYVAADKPLDCAGSYKIESLGLMLFERIDSHDQTAIQGLPLMRLGQELRALGLQAP
ncbi:MAG: nucleoside triphosphate pyrophosphatase [Planctomycetota bacterium]